MVKQVKHRNHDKYVTVKREIQAQPRIKHIEVNPSKMKPNENALKKMKIQVQKLLLPFIGEVRGQQNMTCQTGLDEDYFRSNQYSIHTEHVDELSSEKTYIQEEDAAVSSPVGPDGQKQMITTKTSKTGQNPSRRSASESFRIANEVFVKVKAPK